MTDPLNDSDEAELARQQIEQTRAELAETVDALSDKLNAKAQAAEKVGEVKARIAATAHQAKQSAPEPVQRALDAAGAKASPVAHQVAQRTAPYRGKIIAGALAAAVVLIVVRRKRAAE